MKGSLSNAFMGVIYSPSAVRNPTLSTTGTKQGLLPVLHAEIIHVLQGQARPTSTISARRFASDFLLSRPCSSKHLIVHGQSGYHDQELPRPESPERRFTEFLQIGALGICRKYKFRTRCSTVRGDAEDLGITATATLDRRRVFRGDRVTAVSCFGILLGGNVFWTHRIQMRQPVELPA